MSEGASAIRAEGLSPHEQRVAALYAESADKWFEFSRRVGQKPYSTWGFWGPDTTSPDQAFDAMIEAVASRAGIGPQDGVLDVGCGCGISSLDIQTVTGCREVVGVDIAGALLAEGRRLADAAGKQGLVQLQEMSATSIAFEPSRFDVVTAIDCACHFNPRTRFFEHAARVLRPGGRLVLIDLVLGRTSNSLVSRLLERFMMSSWRIPVENRVDTAGLARQLEAAGFRDVAVEPVGARMLPGAVAFMSSESYRKAYRDVFGAVGSGVWQGMIRVLRWMHARGIFEFVLVSAVRQG